MKALNELLQSLFSVDELRRFVALLPGKNLSAQVPGGSVSLAALAFEVVGVLERHRRLDSTFFELLAQERPARRDEIASVRALVLSAKTPATPPPVPSTRRRAKAADPLDPLARKIEQVLARKQRLETAGQPTDDVLAELRQLKREHRRGGQLRRGDALGERYLLTAQIGRGGFATVWRARDGASGDEVAIKVLHPELAGDTIRRQRFFRGARIMAELAHPLVVGIREREAEDDGFFYYVMDFVPGGNLQDAVLEHRVKREHAVPIILSIGQALAAAHQRGHAHRDVKPVNVLLTEFGEPRLTDFDLVTGTDTTGGTRTGALGTFLYAAPEMMDRPQDADARADVYGLGMTMAFLLHGDKLPRKALTARERFIQNLRATPAIKAALKRATAEDSEDRYPDAAAFCHALRAAISLVNLPVEDALPVVTRHDRHASTQWPQEGQYTARIRSYASSPGRYFPGVMILAIMTMSITGVWVATRYQSAENSDGKTVASRPTSDTAAGQSHQPIAAPEAPEGTSPEASSDTQPDAAVLDAGDSRVTTGVPRHPERMDPARIGPQRPSDRKSQPRSNGSPQPEGSTSPAQPSADSCLDEVGCLLADNPPACCSRYSGGGTHAQAPGTTLPKLSRSEIIAGVNLVRPRLGQCTGMGSGEVKLTVQVAAQTGLVEDVIVKSAPNAVLGTCVANAMRWATFARGKQLTTFTYPFVF